MATCHNADFVEDSRFKHAFECAEERADYGYAWNIRVFCWAFQQAMNVDGDVVECGTNRGMSVAAALEYVNWNGQKAKSLYLFDTFSGLVKSQVTSEDKAALSNTYKECYEDNRNYFSKYANVNLVKGVVPDSLSTVNIGRVSFLHIDMNCVEPEKAALEYFWPRMTPSGIILLDDYGWRGFENQKRMHDEFAKRVNHEVLPLPTGQGLIVCR